MGRLWDNGSLYTVSLQSSHVSFSCTASLCAHLAAFCTCFTVFVLTLHPSFWFSFHIFVVILQLFCRYSTALCSCSTSLCCHFTAFACFASLCSNFCHFASSYHHFAALYRCFSSLSFSVLSVFIVVLYLFIVVLCLFLWHLQLELELKGVAFSWKTAPKLQYLVYIWGKESLSDSFLNAELSLHRYYACLYSY